MENCSTKKFIDFIITQNCTYSCEYCSQSKRQTKTKEYAKRNTIEAFYRFIEQIDRDFEITITGGEAILHPDFFEIIEKASNFGFKINLITNFSFNINIYQKIFNILGSALNRFDISFHLDEIKNFNETIEKLKLLLDSKPKNTKTVFLIPIYNLTPEKEEKIDCLLKIADEYKIEYDFQHIRILNQYQKLSKNEEKYLTASKKQKTFGKICAAGNLSAVIYQNGEVYRCYSSRFAKSNRIGNLNEKNFKLKQNAAPCTFKYCTCPKPALYKQITDKKDYFKAIIAAMKNIIHFPFIALKQKEIILLKLKQKFAQNR